MIDPVALLKEYHAALNAFDLDKVASMVADDATYISPGLNGALKGRGLVMDAMRHYFSEFENQVSTDVEIIKLDETAAQAHWHLIATSNTTGQQIKRQGLEIIHFNSNGLIVLVEVQDQPILNAAT